MCREAGRAKVEIPALGLALPQLCSGSITRGGGNKLPESAQRDTTSICLVGQFSWLTLSLAIPQGSEVPLDIKEWEGKGNGPVVTAQCPLRWMT